MKQSSDIKQQILEALKHPEAEEGLYFKNLYQLHEEDTRPVVPGTEEEILIAVGELVEEGKVKTNQVGEEVIFYLA